MSIETELIKFMNESPAIGAEVFYERADDDEAIPHIIMSVENRDQVYLVGSIASLKHITIELACYAANALGACQLGDAVLGLLDNFKGAIGPLDIQSVKKLSDSDGHEAGTGASFRSITLTIGYQ